MRISVLLGLVVTLLFPGWRATTDAAAPDETVRIAIVKNAASVRIDGDGLLAVRENGEAVPLTTPVTVTGDQDTLYLDGAGYGRLTFASPSAVVVNGKPYRGRAEITPGSAGLLVVNELPLEEYLVGLINCEISSAWPIEAVKAQAVIARTYALNRKEARKNAPFHMESTVIDQVYDGCMIEDSRARRAVSETAGEVLTFNSSIIQAFYHSSCGGRTEAAENVWGAALSYMKGVECEYCLSTPSATWEQRLSLREIEEKFRAAGFNVSGVTTLRPGVRNNRGRLRNVVAVSPRGETVVTGDQFRKILGYGVIKSTNFTMKVANGLVAFSGTGNGHGVGLCQWGAKQRALAGFSYTEILSYYYPGTTLNTFPDFR